MNARAQDFSPGFDAVDARLIDYLHEGFPLSDRPFAEVGAAQGLAEDEVIERLARLLAGGVLTRIGPLYQIERAGGNYLLAALEVPEARFDEVATLVNAHLQVAHNYRREHRLNMWFVVAADSTQGTRDCIDAIGRETGLRVHSFPKEREYRVELRLPALGDPGAALAAPPLVRTRPPAGVVPLEPIDRQLIAATQSGLPLVPTPYEALGAMLGVEAREVQQRLAALQDAGVIRRIGAVANHYRLGYTANGMTVWDVDDSCVDELGERIGRLAGVTHCYRRTRALPDWPYNLFVMLHSRSRAGVELQARAVEGMLGSACRGHETLYSTRVLKKTGLRLAMP